MKDKFVPKIVKSYLRRVLLSKPYGISIFDVLREYRRVSQENLDFQDMGFSHILELLRAVPDVARIVRTQKDIVVFGVVLTNPSITARKSPVTLSDGVRCSRDFRIFSPEHQSPGFKMLRIGWNFPKRELTTVKEDIPKKVNTHKKENSPKKMQDHHESQASQLAIKTENISLLKPAEEGQQKRCFEPEFEIPKSMSFGVLQRMYCDVSPGSSRPTRFNYPSVVDIMLTHVERDAKHFWGIIVQPFDPGSEKVLDLGSFSEEFPKYEEERRAVVKYQGYFCRVWVKSIEGDLASVFMVDFGNSEVVSLGELRSSPLSAWTFQPAAVPFRYG